jgi:hypothetical protein
LRGYKYEPIVSENEDGVLEVSVGEPCDGSGFAPIPDPDAPDLNESSSAASVSKLLGWGLAALVGRNNALAGSTLAMGMTVGLLSSSAPTVVAQQEDIIAECDLVPIEVEIYVDSMADELVQMEYQTGEFEICPPESKSYFYTSAFLVFTRSLIFFIHFRSHVLGTPP